LAFLLLLKLELFEDVTFDRYRRIETTAADLQIGSKKRKDMLKRNSMV
jgi:hypothetical protein